MKKFAVFLTFLAFLPSLLSQEVPTASTNRVWRPTVSHPDGGHFARFIPISKIRKPADTKGEKLVKADFSKFKASLPIDWAKSFDFPMDLNDTYGDCYYAAGCHADNTWTANAGTQSFFALSAIKSRYFALSGGDNGLNDSDMQGEMMNRYLADVAQAKIVSWADIDTTNPDSAQAAIYNFGCVLFTFAVPNNWINNSNTGAVWDTGSPNPNNGHAVIWNGVKEDGSYRLQTWGTYVWITQRGVRSCDPGGWVAFSTRWFNNKGYAPNGKHITELAQVWKSSTGKTIAQSVIDAFPPVGPTPPGPGPLPPGPGPVGVLGSGKLADGTAFDMVPQGSEVFPKGTRAFLKSLLEAMPQKGAAYPPATNEERIELREKKLQESELRGILDAVEKINKRVITSEKKIDVIQKSP